MRLGRQPRRGVDDGIRRAALRALGIALVIASMGLGSARAAKTTNPAVQPNLVPAGWPQAVAIPRIGVRAPLESISLHQPRDVHAPFQWNDAGWYNRGPKPGDPGRAFIFGHLDSTCCPAVFWSLSSLHPGDLVAVSYRNARTLTFRVIWQHIYANAQLPSGWIFGPARQRGLVLFTCAGIFHRDGTGYDHKLVVYARMVMPGGTLG